MGLSRPCSALVMLSSTSRAPRTTSLAGAFQTPRVSSVRAQMPAMWPDGGTKISVSPLVAAGFAMLLRLGPGVGYTTGLLPAVVVCFGLGMGIAYPVFTIAAVSGVDDAEQGVAAGVQSTALQVGGGLGLALVSGAVAVALGPGQGQPTVDALHLGAAVGTALPLLGAAVAAVGLGLEAGGGPEFEGHAGEVLGEFLPREGSQAYRGIVDDDALAPDAFEHDEMVEIPMQDRGRVDLAERGQLDAQRAGGEAELIGDLHQALERCARKRNGVTLPQPV